MKPTRTPTVPALMAPQAPPLRLLPKPLRPPQQQQPPRPLRALDARGIVGLLTDIDDTLTTEGALTADAYRALCALQAAGLAVVPVTGRSAGWAQMIARTWPVAAVVAESGGLYFAPRRDRQGRMTRVDVVYHDDAQRIERDRKRLQACAERVLAAVPGLRPASDNRFRLVDLALDYCEEVPRVPQADVQRAIAMLRAAGFCARASSVHINAWSGDFDKAPMAIRAISEVLPQRRFGNLQRWAFVGDAPNDASMFAAFRHSVGVANIVPSLPQLAIGPAYLTRASFGAGFVELARHLLRARR